MPGRFAEGPRSPGFILPASAVSEQENYGGSKPQTFVVFRVCNYNFFFFSGLVRPALKP